MGDVKPVTDISREGDARQDAVGMQQSRIRCQNLVDGK